MDSIPCNDGFIEGKAGFGTIPEDEFVNRVLVAALRLWRTQANKHCASRLLQIRESELGFRSSGLSPFGSPHGSPPPNGRPLDGTIRSVLQVLDTSVAREYEVLREVGSW